MVESKVKLSRTDLALLSHQYDIRVNAAIEEPQASLPPHLYDKWTLGTTFFHILFRTPLLFLSPLFLSVSFTLSHTIYLSSLLPSHSYPLLLQHDLTPT